MSTGMPPMRAVLLATALAAFAGVGLAQTEADLEPLDAFPHSALEIETGGKQLKFDVWIADTTPRRAQGLMFVKSLAPLRGMLFVYPQPRVVSMWMKNTLIPLDMLFFDAEGRLVSIKHDARPLDETPVPGGDAIRYVLEINGGLAAELGIELGAELRHPAIEDAAWPCA